MFVSWQTVSSNMTTRASWTITKSGLTSFEKILAMGLKCCPSMSTNKFQPDNLFAKSNLQAQEGQHRGVWCICLAQKENRS